MKTIFSDNYSNKIARLIEAGEFIDNIAGEIKYGTDEKAKQKGVAFAEEVINSVITDFEKTEELFNAGKVNVVDKMVHVSTFDVIDNILYMTYYANVQEAKEEPTNQIARFVYCPIDDVENKTFLDIQAVGDICYGLPVNQVYDTIFARTDTNDIIILWTAKVGDNYYRLYRTFSTKTKELGEVQVNRFKVGDIVNDFSTSGIKNAMAENDLHYKRMFNDIGIMQKFTSRIENGEKYYYTGAYSGDYTWVIKSKDFITWEYVAQPDFLNNSKYENATYVIGNKCYYFVRQQDEIKHGFLTVYDLDKETWEKPVLIEDCQSRSDFIEYKGELYLFHAPVDREHIGIVKINKDDIAKSEIVLEANMRGSFFYPFIQYLDNQELGISYTVDRKHIRLSKFTLSKYL